MGPRKRAPAAMGCPPPPKSTHTLETFTRESLERELARILPFSSSSKITQATTLSMLRMALLEEPTSDAERHAQERMRQMHELIDRLMTWFDDVQKLAPETALQLMGMGATVTRVLEFKDRMTGRSPRATREE